MHRLHLLLFCIYISSAVTQKNATDDAAAAAAEIQEALQFSKAIEAAILEFMQHKLPAAALPEARRVLSDTKMAVSACESSLQRAEQIWQYKTCSSALLRNAMSELSELAAHRSAAAKGFQANAMIFACVLTAFLPVN